jgi:hypothetical protein
MDMTTDEISRRDSACVITHADNTELSGNNENQPRNQGQNPSTARDATSIRTKFFHGRKVTTVNAKDVQECKVIDNSSHIKQLACHIKELSTKPRPDKRKIKNCANRWKQNEKRTRHFIWN